jgi:hypothetical protein
MLLGDAGLETKVETEIRPESAQEPPRSSTSLFSADGKFGGFWPRARLSADTSIPARSKSNRYIVRSPNNSSRVGASGLRCRAHLTQDARRRIKPGPTRRTIDAAASHELNALHSRKHL